MLKKALKMAAVWQLLSYMSVMASPKHDILIPDSLLPEADYLVALKQSLVALQYSLFAQHELAMQREQ